MNPIPRKESDKTVRKFLRRKLICIIITRCDIRRLWPAVSIIRRRFYRISPGSFAFGSEHGRPDEKATKLKGDINLDQGKARRQTREGHTSLRTLIQ